MSTRPSDRLAAGLGVLAILSPLFALSNGANTFLVAVHGAAFAIFPVIGLVALLGALLAPVAHRGALLIVAGAIALVTGILQLAQFGRSTDWVGGNGSTATLLLGLALGLLILGLADTKEPEEVTSA